MRAFRTAFFVFCFANNIAGSPPNTSLATLPVAYYGASWPDKTDAEIDMLAKQRVVVLMQGDGECHRRCCPHMKGANCHNAPMFNVSQLPGCEPSCDQHATQDAVFKRIAQAATKAGRPSPHFMLYANSVYVWPFDKILEHGMEEILLYGTDGTVHAETNDGGVYPSYFLDFGKPAGHDAFLSIFTNYIQKGAADGVYLDCFMRVPISCDQEGGGCVAQRNHFIPQNNATHTPVSQQQADAYAAGKTDALKRAVSIVASKPGGGGMFTNKLWNSQKSHDPVGANTDLFNTNMKQFGYDPANLVAYMNQTRANGYKYSLWDPVRFSEVNRDPTEFAPQCTELMVGAFMMALEPGSYLVCNGWSTNFSKPMGDPLGPAVTDADGVMRRSFALGAKVEWSKKGGMMIEWGDDNQHN